MITEEMIYMALKYKSAKRALGYTYYKDNDRNLIAIYDKDGSKMPAEEHHTIMLAVIVHTQQDNIAARKQKEYEDSIKNI